MYVKYYKEENAMNTTEEAKKTVPKLMVHELIQEFEEFGSALKEVYTFSRDNTEKRQEFIEKINRSQKRLKSHLTRAASAFGLTFDQFCEFLGDSNNFEPSDWEALEATKKRISTNTTNSEPAKKARKSNKNLKI